MLIAVFASFAAKFAVFPLYETRFHFAYLVVCGLVLISIFGRSFRQNSKYQPSAAVNSQIFQRPKSNAHIIIQRFFSNVK